MSNLPPRDSTEEFLNSVLRTARTDLPEDKQLQNILMGIAGETGELIDCYKKQLFQGHDPDLSKVINEIGDILFYLTWLAHHQGFDLRCCMAANTAKLKKRYPVSFSTEASKERIDVDE